MICVSEMINVFLMFFFAKRRKPQPLRLTFHIISTKEKLQRRNSKYNLHLCLLLLFREVIMWFSPQKSLVTVRNIFTDRNFLFCLKISFRKRNKEETLLRKQEIAQGDMSGYMLNIFFCNTSFSLGHKFTTLIAVLTV